MMRKPTIIAMKATRLYGPSDLRVDQTRTSQISRPLESLISCLMQEMAFPNGVFLMTGTGIVPPGDFTLHAGDRVRIDIDSFVLENIVAPQ